MSEDAHVVSIHTCEQRGEPCRSVSRAELRAGRGIVGDRHFKRQDSFDFKDNDRPEKELTLIEQEEIDAFNHVTGLGYDNGLFRRNIVTQGVSLNDLVGKEFMVGDVRVRGIELCEPCASLSKRLGRSVMEHMIHKAGLRAQILSNGSLQAGDAVQC